MMYRQDRTVASGKTRGGGLCIFVNNSCRPHYLPRKFSSIFFAAVYIPPQSEAGTKIALNELYSAISKQENAHLEAALLVTADFNAGKLKSVLPNFYQHV
jgi:hypothetical protein